MVVVEGADHSRLYPPKVASKDAKMGWHIDYGSVARDNPDNLKVVLQINSKTKSSALQEALKNAPHRSYTIFAEVEIDTTQNDEERFADMLEQFDAGLEDYENEWSHAHSFNFRSHPFSDL